MNAHLRSPTNLPADLTALRLRVESAFGADHELDIAIAGHFFNILVDGKNTAACDLVSNAGGADGF